MAEDKPPTADADIPYQLLPHVAQLQAELANALVYGQETRAAAVRKQLAELGAADESTSEATPEKAAETRKAAAAEKPAARSEPPTERVARHEKHVTASPTKPTGKG